MSKLENWKNKARALNNEIYALYLAYRDPRVPWYAKLLILCVAGYAFSPIDLIPDFIPILGYLDDLLLLPLGIALAIKLVPPAVLSECREKARLQLEAGQPRNWIAATFILMIWALILIWIGFRVFRKSY